MAEEIVSNAMPNYTAPENLEFGTLAVRVVNTENVVGYLHAYSIPFGYNEIDSENIPYFNIDERGLIKTLVYIGISYIPNVGGVLATLFDFFWPEDETDVWDEIKDKVEALIDAKTQETVQNILRGDIRHLRERIRQCMLQIDNPKITVTAATHFVNIAEDIIGLERKFDFEFYLLPFYITVVNLKLKFYQFGLMNKKKIGLHEEQVNNFISYINYTVEDPRSGAVAHVTKMCKKQFDVAYNGYAETLYNRLASVRSFCALNGYENIPIWKSIAANPMKNTKPEIQALVFSTQFGRNTAKQSSIMTVDPIPPPLQPKLFYRYNEPTRLIVYLTSKRRIGGLGVKYKNNEYVITGPLQQAGAVDVNFKGEKLLKLVARGTGQIDYLEFHFEKGRVEKVGTPQGDSHTFSLDRHYIIGFLMTGSPVGIDHTQAANIAVSYHML